MTAAVALQIPPSLVVASELLGPVTVEADAVLRFPAGILGFPDCRSFALLAPEREHVYWLQSTEQPSLAFLLVDPFVHFDGYAVDLAATPLVRAAASPDHVLVLSIVTLPLDPSERPTANLQGPVVIDIARREGHQVVLPDGTRGIREPFSL